MKMASGENLEENPELESRRQIVVGNSCDVLVPNCIRMQVDIASLQESRLADSGSLRKKDYTFFWQRKGADDSREHGVGFAVRNTLLQMVELSDRGSERLLSIHLYTSDSPVKEHLILLGDLNARVGADYNSWPSCLGPFGDGQCLLELCSYHGLCVLDKATAQSFMATPLFQALAPA